MMADAVAAKNARQLKREHLIDAVHYAVIGGVRCICGWEASRFGATPEEVDEMWRSHRTPERKR